MESLAYFWVRHSTICEYFEVGVLSEGYISVLLLPCSFTTFVKASPRLLYKSCMLLDSNHVNIVPTIVLIMALMSLSVFLHLSLGKFSMVWCFVFTNVASSACTPAPPGWFVNSSTPGVPSPKPVPPGYYNPSLGGTQAKAFQCPAGKYSQSGSTACTPVPAGTFSVAGEGTTMKPSGQPTSQPSMRPSGQPSTQPSGQPTGQPSMKPSGQPTVQPSGQPSGQPST